uniref:Uncharacterized protein n=1 Tax=Pseudictyota dubia TaxID=2749911 RepID=A0A7R9WK18_9STRA|mmetsp:Transcript_5701/g.9886  ORF Transcript_5701/g.9886 Transcript_5701/m.9886 type:complete len:791 (+) Transcript_5701:116-2488(+)|eukprot:CAMPEP_0197465716 /NCGR_PEP_ID=MMETSP1175-20131217/64678_1 /TAXON_ID=1003142 /ORGANISM="Triceratium dubium, Strain CCMP147" /LENGTH=790 /DNA_ID=CAMNT_0043001735 /DNA_START=481 /DNA_END=2853 /DNA_ORIENTATION=-
MRLLSSTLVLLLLRANKAKALCSVVPANITTTVVAGSDANCDTVDECGVDVEVSNCDDVACSVGESCASGSFIGNENVFCTETGSCTSANIQGTSNNVVCSASESCKFATVNATGGTVIGSGFKALQQALIVGAERLECVVGSGTQQMCRGATVRGVPDIYLERAGLVFGKIYGAKNVACTGSQEACRGVDMFLVQDAEVTCDGVYSCLNTEIEPEDASASLKHVTCPGGFRDCDGLKVNMGTGDGTVSCGSGAACDDATFIARCLICEGDSCNNVKFKTPEQASYTSINSTAGTTNFYGDCYTACSAYPDIFNGVSLPNDSDNDCVKDDVDLCLGTAAGEVVNENGCAATDVDVDGDGVCETFAPETSYCTGQDLCPGTSTGLAVDQFGCSDAQVDTDGDGVCNADAPSRGPNFLCTGIDLCPSTLTLTVVDNFGCASEQCQNVEPSCHDGDTDLTNEIQRLVLNSATGEISLELSPDGSSGVGILVDDDLTNELQELVYNNASQTISLQPGGIKEIQIDTDNMNELQRLAFDETTGMISLELSPDGSFGDPIVIDTNETNEIQRLVFDDTAGTITLEVSAEPGTPVAIDADNTNELQSIAYDSVSKTLSLDKSAQVVDMTPFLQTTTMTAIQAYANNIGGSASNSNGTGNGIRRKGKDNRNSGAMQVLYGGAGATFGFGVYADGQVVGMNVLMGNAIQNGAIAFHIEVWSSDDTNLLESSSNEKVGFDETDGSQISKNVKFDRPIPVMANQIVRFVATEEEDPNEPGSFEVLPAGNKATLLAYISMTL